MHDNNPELTTRYKKLSFYINSLVELFIPDACRRNQHEEMRTRILVVILLGLTLLLSSLHVFLANILAFTDSGAALSRRVILHIAIGSFVSLLALRAFNSRKLASHLFGLILWAGLIQTAIFSGGIETPALSLFILIPVFVGLTGGTVGGSYWGAIVCATWIGLLLVTDAGYEFTQVVFPANAHRAEITCLALTCILVIIGVIQYERINYQLHRDIAHERASFRYLAQHDPLTGLPNRRHFLTELDQVLRRAKRTKTRAALLFIDLNQFKPVNDKLGHNAGDQVLQNVARRLQAELRTTDLVARWGGDEFAVIIEHLDTRQNLVQVADKLQQALSQPMDIQGQAISIGASLGSAVFPDQATDAEQLQKLADAAMYDAKSQYGDQQPERE